MLYLISTPIGNIDDITLRALKLFKELDVFFCEDTRTTKKLFNLYDIDYRDKTFHSFHTYTKPHQQQFYLDLLTQKDCGLVSEAGLPGLSDPGKTLIFACHEHKVPFTILPGANALMPAVVSAGFPTQHFAFYGFLPIKKGRQTLLTNIVKSEIPVFFYESVHRIERTLKQLDEYGFVGNVSISREISKLFEQHVTDDLPIIRMMIEEKKIPLKGEFVVGIYADKKKKKKQMMKNDKQTQ